MAMNMTASPKQLKVLSVIDSFVVRHKSPPTLSELSEILGYKSQNSAVDHILRLEKKGLLTRRSGLSRTIALTPKGHGELHVFHSDDTMAPETGEWWMCSRIDSHLRFVMIKVDDGWEVSFGDKGQALADDFKNNRLINPLFKMIEV
jgi:hypothetical protein